MVQHCCFRVLGNQSFVFSDWMKFIECRKAVVSAYHLPTRASIYGDTVGRDPQLFIQHYGDVMKEQELNNRGISKRYGLSYSLLLYYIHSIFIFNIVSITVSYYLTFHYQLEYRSFRL